MTQKISAEQRFTNFLNRIIKKGMITNYDVASFRGLVRDITKEKITDPDFHYKEIIGDLVMLQEWDCMIPMNSLKRYIEIRAKFHRGKATRRPTVPILLERLGGIVLRKGQAPPDEPWWEEMGFN